MFKLTRTLTIVCTIILTLAAIGTDRGRAHPNRDAAAHPAPGAQANRVSKTAGPRLAAPLRALAANRAAASAATSFNFAGLGAPPAHDLSAWFSFAPAAMIPSGAFVTFTTIADGNYSNPAIYAGGVAPGSTISAADTVNINNVVTYDLGADLEVSGVFNINNGGTFRTALTGTGSGRSVFIRSGGKLNVTNGNFILPLFSCGYGCLTGSPLSGNLINQNGMITATNSRVEVAQNFEDTSDPNGGMRTVTGGCLRVGENFINKGSVDLYDGTCIEIGLHGSGNFRNEFQMTFQNSVILKLVGSGNLENVGSGPGVLGGPGSPDISNLGISNGNLVNDRPWSAQVLNFCVSGNVSGSQAADFNNDVTNNDTPAACTAVNAANCNAACGGAASPNPILTKSFFPTSFINGGTTTLTFTIDNTGTGSVAQTGLAFTDTLPGGLRVANPSNAATTCGAGTVTATAGGSTISLSGGSVAANNSCTVTVSVTNQQDALNPLCNGNPPAFTNSSTNISGLSSNLTNGVVPSCVTVTAPLPTLTKSFFPTTFVNGGTTTLTFTITNTAPGSAPQSGLAFTDTLPSSLRVASPPNIVGACGGTVTAVAGGTTIALSGGTLAAGGTCSFSVNVTNVPGELNPLCNGNPLGFTNTAANISGLSNNLINGVTPSCVTVTAPLPVLTKSFSPMTFVNGGTTTLTFTITNTAMGAVNQTGLAFTDTLPSNLMVANPANVMGACGGTVTAAAGGATIALSGGSLAAGGTCSFSVNVTNVLGQLNPSCGGNPPAFTNSATNISGLSGNLINGVTPSCVIVTGPNPTLTKSFSPTTFVNGGTTTLTFTISNTETGATAQTGLAFTDTLPSSLRVASPPNIVGACGGTVTAVAGGTTIALSGGSLAAGGTCSFSVDVTNVPGEVNASCDGNPPAFTNSAGNISGLSSTLNNGVTPSCVIVTAPLPVLTKSFNPTTFVNGGTTTLTFTITNTATGSVARTGLAFTDTLPSSLLVANPPNIVGACGGTVTAVAGGTTIALSGGSLAAGGTCSFSVDVTNVPGALNAVCNGEQPAFTNTAGNISGLSSNLTNGVTPSCVTVTAPLPVLTKAFSPTTFVNGGTTTLTFNIGNGATGSVAQNISFTDTLPSGLIVATPPGVVNGCGGTVTAAAGGTTIAFAGTIGAGSACSFSVQVTNVPGMLNASCEGNPPAFTNSAANITSISSNLVNGVAPSCVTVTGPNPTLTKLFSPTTFVDGGTTTLTFTITNTATGAVAQTGLAFTDTLPSGLRVASPPNVVGACGGTVTAVAGGTTISLSGGSLAAGGSCTFSVQVTNVPGQLNASCDGNPAAFTNSATNISGLSSTLINGVQPSCVTVTSTPPGPTPKGPGLPYPDDAEVSDQKAGSVLVYPIYTSNASNPNTQNTRISITNVDPNRDVAVHLFFVDGESCSIADVTICLTGNQTASFLTSDLDPGTTGYLIAIATDPVTGCPIKFNCLIGDEYVKFASGHQANLGAEAFSAIAATPAACDNFSFTAQLNFDGVSYNRVPRVLAASNILAPADGNDTMLILNRFGGNLAIGAARLSDIFGIFYNDAENGVSFGFNPGLCQFRSSLSNSFPRITPRLGNFITTGRSGWLRLFPTSDIGLLGATLNFNQFAGSNASAFNQGHNLHKLTLSSTQTLIIPIIPPNCR